MAMRGDVQPEEEKMVIISLEKEIQRYRENDNMYHSPVWIWFGRLSHNEANCIICG